MKIGFYGESSRRKLRAYLIESSKNTKIFLDCGRPQNSNNSEIIPDYIPDNIIQNIDGIFITHAHLDHWGYLPRLIMKGYNNPIFMTKPTKDILAPAIDLFLKEIKYEMRSKYFSVFSKLGNLIQTYNYGDLIDLNDFNIFFLPANHIFGSAQILVEEKNLYKQILYTGDFNPKGSSLFNPIHIESLNSKYNIDINPKVVIIEASKVDFKEDDYINEENTFIKMVNDTYNDRGNILIPVSAIGDAQNFLIKYLDYVFEDKIKVPIDTYTIGTLLKVNKIYVEYKNELKNPELVDFFDKYMVLKIFEDTLAYEYNNNWDIFFNNKTDFGNKLFIATGGNLVGSAFRVYNYLKNASKHLIIKTTRFKTNNCIAKVLKLHIFSLHGNYDSMLRYINEIEGIGKTHFFLVHGLYRNLKNFKVDLDTKNISNKIPNIQESYNI